MTMHFIQILQLRKKIEFTNLFILLWLTDDHLDSFRVSFPISILIDWLHDYWYTTAFFSSRFIINICRSSHLCDINWQCNVYAKMLRHLYHIIRKGSKLSLFPSKTEMNDGVFSCPSSMQIRETMPLVFESKKMQFSCCQKWVHRLVACSVIV